MQLHWRKGCLKNRLSRMGRSWWRLYVCMGSGRTRKSGSPNRTRSDCASDEKRKKYTASYHNRVKYGDFFCVTSCVFSAPFLWLNKLVEFRKSRTTRRSEWIGPVSFCVGALIEKWVGRIWVCIDCVCVFVCDWLRGCTGVL